MTGESGSIHLDSRVALLLGWRRNSIHSSRLRRIWGVTHYWTSPENDKWRREPPTYISSPTYQTEEEVDEWLADMPTKFWMNVAAAVKKIWFDRLGVSRFEVDEYEWAEAAGKQHRMGDFAMAILNTINNPEDNIW